MAYTNSPLVSYTRLSPNHSGERTHAIDTITPHCVVGQCTVQSLGEVFAKESRQASSNYGIGTDGKVALYVPESCRSWCSSSRENDQRAITIENASDNFAPYAFNNTVYNRLVDLCVDICQRNGKNKMVWFNDKATRLAYEPKSNEMKFTLHRDLAATSCPGEWLVARMQDLTNRINAKLGGASADPTPTTTPVQPTTPTSTPTPTSSATAGMPDDQIVWNYLMKKINNAYGVAGLMGNLWAESGLRANNLQNTYEQKFGMSDVQYTAAVDSGAYGNFIHDSAGYGLAQWTFWSRKQGLLNYARSKNASIGDLNMQLDFLYYELSTGYKGVLSALERATSVAGASDIVLTQFERPADQSQNMKNRRAGYGQSFYDKYKNGTPMTPKPAATSTDVPFVVRILADDLYVRKGPGKQYDFVLTVHKKSAYTIVEVQNGWGKLKSGVGWICLEYTERV